MYYGKYAFSYSQNLLREVAHSQGQRDETYHQALEYTRTKCRTQGIDAALTYVTADNQTSEYDALLLCDRMGPGQQLAAQAGKHTGNLLSGHSRY